MKIHPAALTIIAMLAGFAGGRILHSGTGGLAQTESTNSRVPSGAGAGYTGLTSPLPAESHGYEALLARLQQMSHAGTSLSRELERLDVGELKNLLNSVSAAIRKESYTGEEEFGIGPLLSAASRELASREGARALEWASALQEDEGGAYVMRELVEAVACISPELAKPWYDGFRKATGGRFPVSFMGGPFTAAAERGADDLARFIVLFDLVDLGAPPEGGYPRDFDFARLVSTLGDSDATAHVLTRWSAQDKEAAWTAMMEMKSDTGTKGHHVYYSAANLYEGVATSEGDDAALRWLSAKLNTLPVAVDTRMGRELASAIPDEYEAAFVAALQRDEDKLALAWPVVSPTEAEAWPRKVAMLQALGSEALQAEIYARIAYPAGNAQAGSEAGALLMTTWSLEKLQTEMDLLEFSPASREKVLAAWQSGRDSMGKPQAVEEE